MADGSEHQHHSIDYIEFTAASLERAKAFYSGAFGWTFKDYGPTYAGIQGPEREVGGITEGEPSGRGGPLVVLFSNDLDATLTAIQAAGGEIIKPIFEFPGGRRFHFADPSGNELAVWALP